MLYLPLSQCEFVHKCTESGLGRRRSAARRKRCRIAAEPVNATGRLLGVPCLAALCGLSAVRYRVFWQSWAAIKRGGLKPLYLGRLRGGIRKPV